MNTTQRALQPAASTDSIRLLSIAMLRLYRLVQRGLLRYRQHRKAADVRDALGELDDRALHDLGLHRDEITSVAAEFSHRAERTRLQALHLPPAVG